MKAVNLIPVDERRGGAAGGRSAAPSYAVLGALAVLVVMAVAWTLTGNTVKDRKASLSRVQQEATAAETQATKLAAYSAFSDLRKKRAETVTSIAKSRFDWAHLMHEVARVIPTDTHLISLAGSVSPTAQVPGGVGSALQLRGASAGPAIDIVGCATSQANVARMMSRLRLIDGVEHVTLAESSKNDSNTGSAATTDSSGDNGDCRYNSAIAKFDVLLLFAAPPAVAAPASTTTGTAAPASATTTTTTSTGSTK